MKEDDLDIYYHIINDKWYVSVEDYKKLKNIIDEAIEYIEQQYKYEETAKEDYDILLDILKEKEEER